MLKLRQTTQKPGYVLGVPSYEVVPPNGYWAFPCTTSSIQMRAATAPSVQCPAVKTTVGERSAPVQRQAGPFASSKTRSPTYGCAPWSGCPEMIADGFVFSSGATGDG